MKDERDTPGHHTMATAGLLKSMHVLVGLQEISTVTVAHLATARLGCCSKHSGRPAYRTSGNGGRPKMSAVPLSCDLSSL